VKTWLVGARFPGKGDTLPRFQRLELRLEIEAETRDEALHIAQERRPLWAAAEWTVEPKRAKGDDR
jgi:hypothetical protein